MARITVEDCIKHGYNKFELVHLALRRVIQFRKGKDPLVACSNKEVVTALREIGATRVKKSEHGLLFGSDMAGQLETLVEGGTGAEANDFSQVVESDLDAEDSVKTDSELPEEEESEDEEMEAEELDDEESGFWEESGEKTEDEESIPAAWDEDEEDTDEL